jgi:hypothetical protein
MMDGYDIDPFERSALSIGLTSESSIATSPATIVKRQADCRPQAEPSFRP